MEESMLNEASRDKGVAPWLAGALVAASILLAVAFLPAPAHASQAATLSGKAKKAFVVKLGEIQKAADRQGAPPFAGSNKVMYRFLDVDGDGKKEMLVEPSARKGEISSYVHAAVYKYKSGKVKQVMVDCGWASWMGSFRYYYPKTRTLVTSFYHNSIRESSMAYPWTGKKFELARPGAEYKKGKAVKLSKGWKTY